VVAARTADASGVREVPCTNRLIVGRSSPGLQHVADAVPTIIHVGDATGERFLALPRRPVIARLHPLIDELLGTRLEKVYRAAGERQNHAIWALSIIAWWR
jgi:hypothetical protein